MKTEALPREENRGSVAAALACDNCEREIARQVAFCPYCAEPHVAAIAPRKVVHLTFDADAGKRAFSFDGKSYFELSDLIVAFARHWTPATAVIADGSVAAWAEAGAPASAAYLRALCDDASLDGDDKLFRAIAHCRPDLPPIWREQVVDAANLSKLAQSGTQDALVVEVYRRGLLSAFEAASGRSDFKDFRNAWAAKVELSRASGARNGEAAILAALRGGTSGGESAIASVRPAGTTTDGAPSIADPMDDRKVAVLYLCVTGGLCLGAMMGLFRIVWSSGFDTLPENWSIADNVGNGFLLAPLGYVVAFLALACIPAGFVFAVRKYLDAIRTRMG